ncbi:MAG: hypothetical protein IJJ40_06240 [Clostridia bacterium]|nr:hypothetical protein [Clostridia bacterium]
MSANTWLIIAIVGFSLGGIALISAVFMFIKMNIPSIIGDLSGKTVAREIKAIRESNSKSGDKLHKSSHVNISRGFLTEKVRETDKKSTVVKPVAIDQIVQNDQGANPEITEKISIPTEVLDCDTELLNTDATEVLDDQGTEVLNDSTSVLDTNATMVLKENQESFSESQATTVLSEGTVVLSELKTADDIQNCAVPFEVTKSVISINTDETVEKE